MNIANCPLCSLWQALCKVSSEHNHLLEKTRGFVLLPSDAVPTSAVLSCPLQQAFIRQ